MLYHLAQNLRRLRRERDFTQTTVGNLTGFSQSYVSALERGLRPTRPAHLRLLARALSVREEVLVAPDITISTSGSVRVENHHA